MTGLFLKYNKPHNESLRQLELSAPHGSKIVWGDLSSFGPSVDLLPIKKIAKFLHELKDIDYVIIGDVFWTTGQNICKTCKEMNIKVFFLQHGQWIYTKNKQQLKHYPDCTLLFGKDTAAMCSKWEYGSRSRIEVVGSPRYDNAKSIGSEFIYFSPPVIEEIVHGIPSGIIKYTSLRALDSIIGIDKRHKIIIHPHYREAKIDTLKKLFPSSLIADPTIPAGTIVSRSSKVLATRNSTIVLDAIAHKKPVVLMDFLDNDTSFFKRGYFGDFADESDGFSELMANLSKNTTKEFNMQSVDKYVHLGNASERIWGIIKNGL